MAVVCESEETINNKFVPVGWAGCVKSYPPLLEWEQLIPVVL